MVVRKQAIKNARPDRANMKSNSFFVDERFPLIAILILLFLGSPVWSNTRTISAGELAQHSTSNSCWIAISGSVYDITNYLSEHSNDHNFSLLPWCGKDATKGWKDKDGKGKPHSRKATIQLKRYKIGELE